MQWAETIGLLIFHLITILCFYIIFCSISLCLCSVSFLLSYPAYHFHSACTLDKYHSVQCVPTYLYMFNIYSPKQGLPHKTPIHRSPSFLHFIPGLCIQTYHIAHIADTCFKRLQHSQKWRFAPVTPVPQGVEVSPITTQINSPTQNEWLKITPWQVFILISLSCLQRIFTFFKFLVPQIMSFIQFYSLTKINSIIID